MKNRMQIQSESDTREVYFRNYITRTLM